MAINLRMAFFSKYVLGRKVRDYKTPVEKDWMYIAQREYWYDVNCRAAADGSAAGLTAAIIRMTMVKKMIYIIIYLYYDCQDGHYRC